MLRGNGTICREAILCPRSNCLLGSNLFVRINWMLGNIGMLRSKCVLRSKRHICCEAKCNVRCEAKAAKQLLWVAKQLFAANKLFCMLRISSICEQIRKQERLFVNNWCLCAFCLMVFDKFERTRTSERIPWFFPEFLYVCCSNNFNWTNRTLFFWWIGLQQSTERIRIEFSVPMVAMQNNIEFPVPMVAMQNNCCCT